MIQTTKMKKLNPEEVEDQIAFEDACGVNDLLQMLFSSENEGKNLEVWRDDKGECVVVEANRFLCKDQTMAERLQKEYVEAVKKSQSLTRKTK